MAEENIIEQLFSPIGQGIRGMARGLFPGAAGAADLDRKRIQALLDSEEGQRLLRESQILMNKARAEAMDRGEGYYGGRGVDPYVKGSEDLGKIQKARDSFLTVDEKGKPVYGLTLETEAYFEAAEKSVLDRMKSTPTRDNREYFGPGDETDVIAALSRPKKKVYEAPTEWLRTKEVPEVLAEIESKRPLADYFQASTETVPEGNIPKTYPQMGIESIDDQAILADMQQALPDVDMKSEYEADPEMMKKLMELWRAKKLTKQNLHKAFSMIQQSAQQSLGLR